LSESARDAFPAPETSREVARLSHDASDARERSRRSAERVVEVEQTLAVVQARSLTLEQSLEEQRALATELGERLERADRVVAAMQRSLSWRITAPLRALKRRR
jgi:predicted  nucleic acid-binding Zn-ribbon protein